MKKSEGEDLILKKELDLGNGLAIYKVHVDRCRERDVNAQVMDKAKFDQLVENISKDNRLESLPFGYIAKNPSGNEEFYIISGHHRIRAARKAAVTEIYVLASVGEMTEDQITSAQLAHNALVGSSDDQVLRKMWDSIQAADEKIRSGVRIDDFKGEKFKAVRADEISLDFDVKTIKIMFLRSGLDTFEEVLTELAAVDKAYIAPMAEFDKVAETIRAVSKSENVRNAAGILTRMCEICEQYIAAKKSETVEE